MKKEKLKYEYDLNVSNRDFLVLHYMSCIMCSLSLVRSSSKTVNMHCYGNCKP